MGKFRLKLATQAGEKLAADAGFTAFPINPRKIAEDRNIEVQAKPPEAKGISGALIFANDQVTLIYSTEYDNRGFETFSIAHELGHFFLPGHPDEIMKAGGTHISRANFTENTSIELEADHFASGLLLPSTLTRKFLHNHQIGLDGIVDLAERAETSLTAAAIRAAECNPYPMAIVVSQAENVSYAFMTDSFKALGKLAWLKKGTPLPASETRTFNSDADKVLTAQRAHGETDLCTWFDGSSRIVLDEEIIGLGNYGYTLTILSSESLPEDPDQEEDEEAELVEQWTPRFAYKR